MLPRAYQTPHISYYKGHTVISYAIVVHKMYPHKFMGVMIVHKTVDGVHNKKGVKVIMRTDI